MSGGHAGTDRLLHPGDSLLHRLPPELKIAATLAFVLAVVATPWEAVWAFVVDGLLLLIAVRSAGLAARFVLDRLRIELPFLAFALLMPLVGMAPHVEVLGISLSEPGLWAAWNIVVKGTLGVLAAIVLAGTTPVPDLLTGLDRLRVPRVLTGIAGFMVRYLDVIAGEASRMRIARLSRGHDPRWLWQARAVTASAGTLFVRSYERGERVHLAMCSRGYDGSMPVLHEHPGLPHAWRVAAILPSAATGVMVLARVGVG